MARGVERFNFDFMLCDVIPITVHVTVMFGEVQSVIPTYQGQVLNITEYLFDEDNDFISLEKYFIEYAQAEYDEPLKVISIPE